jgi:hypothetical protein
MEDITTMQGRWRQNEADKQWEKRSKLQERVERRQKMIENVEALLKRMGLSSAKEIADIQEELKRIRGEIDKLQG